MKRKRDWTTRTRGQDARATAGETPALRPDRFQPLFGEGRLNIMPSWKSFTSKEANKVLDRAGDFWEPENFDHLVRSEEEFYRHIEYAGSNPKRAGLKDWKWVWSARC